VIAVIVGSRKMSRFGTRRDCGFLRGARGVSGVFEVGREGGSLEKNWA